MCAAPPALHLLWNGCGVALSVSLGNLVSFGSFAGQHDIGQRQREEGASRRPARLLGSLAIMNCGGNLSWHVAGDQVLC